MVKLSGIGRVFRLFVGFLLFFSFASLYSGQRSGYPSEEFIQRRQALMAKVGEGMIMLFGEALPPPGHHFRQDNDFYYLTGVEDRGAALILTPKTGESFLFLPRQTPREGMMEGANMLKD
ncbi:MAG: aminopeptidase P N-terminal domain-containing protein, partial [Clostridiales bacterium]|nr:aminopeptidase P N-terminal domain-containing protein [Clostridiales bacterium]